MRPVIICGPSGAGKGTLISMLLSRRDDVSLQVSHTSRPPRSGETHGREYYFSTLETMQEMRDRDEFLESCEVHGQIYGSSVDSLEKIVKEGKIPVMDIDIRGCIKLSNHPVTQNSIFVWIDAGDEDTLRERLIKRNTETPEQIERRLQNGKRDSKMSYECSIEWKRIYNVDLEVAYRQLSEIIDTVK